MLVRWVISWSLAHPRRVVLAALALALAGFLALERTSIDVLPDLGERQVLVRADWPGRSPEDVDAQVARPLSAALAGAEGVRTVRSMAGPGSAMLFALLEDSADAGRVRAALLERLSLAREGLPAGVEAALGPDATALGQVFWYTLEGEGFSLDELRALQDGLVRRELAAVEGVSEVASIGGFVREYQVELDSVRLRAHGVSVPEVLEAVRRSNVDVGGEVVEDGGRELLVRGRGALAGVDDLEDVVLRQAGGTPLYVKSVGSVSLGPASRRGALNKEGVEAVGGIVLARSGARPRDVVRAVRERIREFTPGLPQRTLADGRSSRVRLVPYYDRGAVIDETLDALRETVLEELLCAGAVVALFLFQLRAAGAIATTLPLSVALTFLGMALFRVDANVMSIAGLAIAIGDVADMGIIVTENVLRRLAADPEGRRSAAGRRRIVEQAAHEVGPAIVTAVTNTILSFLPVFLLQGEEGKLFRPLAFTKTLAISSSLVLALTVVPAVALLTLRDGVLSRRTRAALALVAGVAAAAVLRSSLAPAVGWGVALGWPSSIALGIVVALLVLRLGSERLVPAEASPVSRGVLALYDPALRWVLAHKAAFLAAPLLLLVLGLTVGLGFDALARPLRTTLAWAGLDPGRSAAWSALDRAFPGLGREFMPPLDEGSFLSMPSLLPAASLSQSLAVLAAQNARLRQVPEVADVVGKAGRSDSALDPAPVGMIETVITLRPESEWRTREVPRFFSGWPAGLRRPLAWLWPTTRRIRKDELLAELEAASAVPGVLATWLQPIQARLVMLSTGFRALLGLELRGEDGREIERIGLEIERLLRQVPGAVDVVADRSAGRPTLEFDVDREAAARYGLRVEDVQELVQVAIGGEEATTAIEGAARLPVRVRLAREERDSLEALGRVLVPTPDGAGVPLCAVGRWRTALGPAEIKRADAARVAYVTFNARGRDEAAVLADADALLRARIADGSLAFPAGTSFRWAGRFEDEARADARLSLLVPGVLVLMGLSIYLGFRRWWIAGIVLLGIAVSVAGGLLVLALAQVHLSVAVWVGVIALLGVADDDAVVILTYCEQLFRERPAASVEEIRARVLEAGRRRIRPCLMTTATTVIGLVPIFTNHGRGSDVMQAMALPSVGGMALQLVVLFLAPCLYCLALERRLARGGTAASAARARP